MPIQENFFSLDLEMAQPSGKIIEVGVAFGCHCEGAEITTHHWLINPGEPLTPEIVSLTGITDEMLETDAVSWETMTSELSTLLDRHQPFANPVTWGGGDSSLLKEGMRERGLAFPYFGHRWLDVKTMHIFLSLAEGRPTRGGLRTVMNRYGLPFQGKAHRAGTDAMNTLRFFFFLLGRQREKSGAGQ